jgi:(S)-ureidoglycine-glyoxylate aminotransferase
VADYGIEIGTSFGPMAGRFWRIGTMGYNARRDTVLLTLAALAAAASRRGIRHAGIRCGRGAGVLRWMTVSRPAPAA